MQTNKRQTDKMNETEIKTKRMSMKWLKKNRHTEQTNEQTNKWQKNKNKEIYKVRNKQTN